MIGYDAVPYPSKHGRCGLYAVGCRDNPRLTHPRFDCRVQRPLVRANAAERLQGKFSAIR
jgi:hypothetical protein